ncbi:MAG: serine hydrolase [Acidobacteria bacterium]|nr:serine hydrolase [Acidobacteriota bacterium]
MHKKTSFQYLTRRELLQSVAAVGVTSLGGAAFAAPPKPYYPRGNEWETRALKDAGLDAAGIEGAIQYAADHNSTGLVILRGGRIVTEKYWKDWKPETSQPIYSSSKSITATLIGMALEDGRIKSLNQSASNFVSAWKGTPKEAITLRHMLTMTSGIKNSAGTNIRDDVDAFEETAALPLEHQPGEVWAYNTPVYRMLIRVLEIAYGQSIDQYTQRKLSGPLGMQYSKWDCSPAPENKTNCTWYRSCLRDMSRFGLLILRNGQWNGKQLISAKYLKESTSTSQKLNESYGYLWWLNGKGSFRMPGGGGGVQPGMLWPDCPPDAFGALGAQDKKIYVVPSLDLVVSRHGGAAGIARGPGAEGGGRSSFDNELLGRICRAVKQG